MRITPDGARLDGATDPLAVCPPGDLARLGPWTLAVLDGWLPEAARLAQLRGADILCFTPRPRASAPERLAGPWQLAQQTQCYAIDAGAEVFGPCELTADGSGRLGGRAEIDLEALRALRRRYDLTARLRPDIYLRHLPW